MTTGIVGPAKIGQASVFNAVVGTGNRTGSNSGEQAGAVGIRVKTPDHYAVLGVATTASAAAIRVARPRALRRHHPDASDEGGDAARRVTLAILVAGEVLLDPVARATYDREMKRSRDADRRSSPAHGPRPTTAGRARLDGDRGSDILCPSCGHWNYNVQRHYCLHCGGGIGPTPRPITVEGARSSASGRIRSVDVGCGVLLGAVPASVFALRFAMVDGLSVAEAWLIVGLPAAAFGILAGVYRERFWDWLSDLLLRTPR